MTGNLEQLFGSAFDPSTVPQDGYEPLPEGEYLVAITDAVMADTKNGLGKQLVLTYTVQTGANADRTMKEWLNLVNQNETAVKIAFQTLAKISNAVGITMLRDSNELVGKRLIIAVGKDKKDTTKTVVKSYHPTSGLATATQAPASPTAQAPAVAASPAGKLPWAK